MKLKVYIIPTKFGLLSGLLLGIMVITGVTYQNNSIFLVAFTLASLLLAIMIETNRNLKALEFIRAEVSDGFAGQPTELRVWLRNKTRARIQGLEISPNLDVSARFNIGRDDQLLCISHINTGKRGRQSLKRIRIGTTAPVGLYWAWTNIDVGLSYVAYPTPAGEPELPGASDNAEQGATDHGKYGEDFAGHKNFEPGSSWRRVDWKAVSRGRPWLIKQFEGGTPTSYVLDFSLIKGSTEERLSQLALWVRKVHQVESLFSLKIPGKLLPMSRGPQHAVRCLEELGLYEDTHNRAA
ncbi:MAG: DUF58 domain-containing protein [Bdellovibrionia bacterium]